MLNSVKVQDSSTVQPSGSQADQVSVLESGNTDISSSGTEPKSSGQEASVKEPTTPSPVKVKTNISPLPSDWRTAIDPQGKVYYYHAVTRYGGACS